MKIVTETVYPDEPCYGLREGPRNVKRQNRFGHFYDETHWIQALYVVRSDAMAEWTQDFGAVDSFKLRFPDATELIVPSYGENSVAQLQELADRHRISDFARRHREKVKAESTLMPDVVRNIEERREHFKNRTTIGPAIFVQRGEYSPTQTARKIKAKQREYKEANK